MKALISMWQDLAQFHREEAAKGRVPDWNNGHADTYERCARQLHEEIRKTDVELSQIAATLGSRGGKIGGLSTSKAKRDAAILNGSKGGRPRKVAGDRKRA